MSTAKAPGAPSDRICEKQLWCPKYYSSTLVWVVSRGTTFYFVEIKLLSPIFVIFIKDSC